MRGTLVHLVASHHLNGRLVTIVGHVDDRLVAIVEDSSQRIKVKPINVRLQENSSPEGTRDERLRHVASLLRVEEQNHALANASSWKLSTHTQP